MNTFYLLLLTLCVLFARVASASPNLGEVNEDTAEEVYAVICQPGSFHEAELSPQEREDSIAQRANYLAFLNNPEPTLATLRASALVHPEKNKELDLAGQLRLVFLYAGTCEATLGMEPWLREGGCTDTQAVRHSAAAAIEGCKDLAREIRKGGN